MKRHRALIGLSHDHHHGLVAARRLRRAAEGDAPARRDAAGTFLEFFGRETRPHFREEEERFFPLLVGADDPAGRLLVEALLEHQQLYALVAGLEGEVAEGDPSAATMRELGRTLESHIRLEERTLFPLLEEVASGGLGRLQDEASPAERTGPLWGCETEDLNATLLAWPAGAGPEEHVNLGRDVLLVVVAGSATVTVDGEAGVVDAGQAIAIGKGSRRRITAGRDGVRYLTVHVRRSPLQIAPAPAR